MVDRDPTLTDLPGDPEEKNRTDEIEDAPEKAPQSSVRIVPEKCVGCAACMRACPTEAIRLRDWKAVINYRFCIDCGECVRVCEHKAGEVLSDPLSLLKKYDYCIAVPEPSLYGQFVSTVYPDEIIAGLQDLGFHEVYEAAVATERISLLLQEYLSRYKGSRPLMTSFCPVVVRLVQLKYPELIDLVIPVDFMLELAIKRLKEEKSSELGIPKERVGAFYLAGCPGRITTVHHPYSVRKTYFDAAVSIESIYKDLMFAIKNRQQTHTNPPRYRKSTGIGIRWGTLGGGVKALGPDNVIAVSDIKHLLRVMEEVDNYKLSDIRFIECRACYAGCGRRAADGGQPVPGAGENPDAEPKIPVYDLGRQGLGAREHRSVSTVPGTAPGASARGKARSGPRAGHREIGRTG